MKLKTSLLLMSICVAQLSCAPLKENTRSLDTLSAAEFQPFGRSLLHKDAGLELISGAVHFGYTFEGTTSKLHVRLQDGNAHNYLQYELDGTYQKKIRVNGNSTIPIEINVPEGKHEIRIFKATEAHTGPIFISMVEGKKIKSLPIKTAPMIEFIGNSITCGAAADASEVSCGTGDYHDQHNAYMAYGPRLARMLQLNFMLSSVSGIGVYRNWNSEGPTMPLVYEKADFQQDRKESWDFRTYSPDVVSIALGTNDFSNGDGKAPRQPFDADAFVSNYVKFVQLVKSKYPKAKIALLSSPMVKGASRIKLQDCISRVQSQIDSMYPDDKVAKFFFEPMEARGCTGHPSVEDHQILAEQLKPFFAGLLR
jgi:lysophospholipase L1-like esterase